MLCRNVGNCGSNSPNMEQASSTNTATEGGEHPRPCSAAESIVPEKPAAIPAAA
ncbi:MAG: hypothetical protein U1E63_01910 [Burkholderiales bacterium]